MNQFKVILCLGIALSFYACEKEEYPQSTADVIQDAVYQIYDITYDKSKDLTRVEANFMSEPVLRRLPLSDAASVSFNEELLMLEGRASYTGEYEGPVSGLLNYQDTNDSIYQNAFKWNSAGFTDEVETIGRNQRYDLEWEGPPMEEGEYFKIIYPNEYSTENGLEVTLTAKIIPENEFEGNTIFLYPGMLERIPLGEVEFILERRWDKFEIDGTSAGGQIQTTYTAIPKTFTITE